MMLSSVGFEDKTARKKSIYPLFPATVAINLEGDRPRLDLPIKLIFIIIFQVKLCPIAV